MLTSETIEYIIDNIKVGDIHLKHSIFPHEIKYQDLVIMYQEEMQQCIESIEKDNKDLFFREYAKLQFIRYLSHTFFNSSITEEIDEYETFKMLEDEFNKLQVTNKEIYNDIKLNE